MSSSQDLFSRLDRLNEIGAALSQERDIDKLLENILVNAKELTGADGGTIYSVSEDKRFLRFSIVRTDSLNIAFGGTTGKPISANFPDLPLYREDGSPNDSMVAASAAIHAHTINLADAYTAEGFDFSGTRWFDQCTGYRSQS
ncbi:MAG: hypothetical protein RIR00_2191, partial [Pseudomonadota bacterium]